MSEETTHKSFTYTHNNPYHDKLGEFDHFVLRDEEGETFKGQWNAKIFQREAPLCLEIGSGHGHFMVEYCQRFPNENFIGMDYRFKRSYQLARKLAKLEETNYRYLRANGERIQLLFEQSELNKLFYFFPDPWPKTRHHKKRLLQPAFLEAVYQVMAPGGKFFIKTDHDDYAQHMEKVIKACPLFDLELETWDVWGELAQQNPEHFLCSFQTQFEKIFIKQGVKVKAFVLTSKKLMPDSLAK